MTAQLYPFCVETDSSLLSDAVEVNLSTSNDQIQESLTGLPI